MQTTTPPRRDPHSEAGRHIAFLAADGVQLHGALFEPAGSPLGRVIIHGAMATPGSYYAPFARFLADAGLLVLTYDYRGVGRSRDGSLRGDTTKLEDWALLDAVAAVAFFDTLADAPLLAIGHSFGGQVSALLPEVSQPDAVLMVGAMRGYYRTMRSPRATWLKARLLVPAATSVYGYLPGYLGTKEDLPAGVANQWMRWVLDPDYYLSSHPEFRDRLSGYGGDVLMLSFTDDSFAPYDNVRWLHDRLEGARVRHIHVRPSDIGLDDVGHFGAFRESRRYALWAPMRDYLLASACGDFTLPVKLPSAGRRSAFGITEADIHEGLLAPHQRAA